MKIKRNAPEVMEADVDVLLGSVRNALNERFVSRSNVVEGLLLGLAAGQHVMLEGPAGIAKTSIVEALASFVDDSNFKLFSAQLAKGTREEELFGPLHIEKLRKDAVYLYHTAGKLPDCHIAILDETYRGSPSLMPRMFSVLNERKFYNGSHFIKCPLRMAVGTTNFMTEDEELLPFKDRWLINIKVAPLSSPAERVQMLMLSEGHITTPDTPQCINLGHLNKLDALVNSCRMSKEMLDLYETIASEVKEKVGNLTLALTDRRLVWASRLAKAAAVLDGRTSVEARDLASTMYGIICVGNEAEMLAFSEVFKDKVESIAVIAEQTKKLDELEQGINACLMRYKPDSPTARKAKIKDALLDLISLNTQSEFTFQVTLDRYDDLINRANKAVNDITVELAASV